MYQNQPIGFKNFPHATNGMQALQLYTQIVIRREHTFKIGKGRHWLPRREQERSEQP